MKYWHYCLCSLTLKFQKNCNIRVLTFKRCHEVSPAGLGHHSNALALSPHFHSGLSEAVNRKRIEKVYWRKYIFEKEATLFTVRTLEKLEVLKSEREVADSKLMNK